MTRRIARCALYPLALLVAIALLFDTALAGKKCQSRSGSSSIQGCAQDP